MQPAKNDVIDSLVLVYLKNPYSQYNPQAKLRFFYFFGKFLSIYLIRASEPTQRMGHGSTPWRPAPLRETIRAVVPSKKLVRADEAASSLPRWQRVSA
jgi:hypothetical protein